MVNLCDWLAVISLRILLVIHFIEDKEFLVSIQEVTAAHKCLKRTTIAEKMLGYIRLGDHFSFGKLFWEYFL
jgi:hypothetical protein